MSNSSIKIFFSSDNELSEWEAVNKGYRCDVFVFYEGSLYCLNIYTPVRLIQDFESEIKSYGFYSVDCNLVLASATDKKTIIFTILKLNAEKYFDKIKPLVNNKTDLLIKVY